MPEEGISVISHSEIEVAIKKLDDYDPLLYAAKKQ